MRRSGGKARGLDLRYAELVEDVADVMVWSSPKSGESRATKIPATKPAASNKKRTIQASTGTPKGERHVNLG
jgi:hypothetical protein